MKKLTLAAIFVLAISLGFAQNGNNICVFNAMSNYNSGGGPDELERGIKCSDEAATNESTINDKKTWFYRGELYTNVFLDTVLKKKYGTASFEAIKAFKKLYDLNDPKFKEWEDVYKYLFPLATNSFNTGVDLFQAGNYAQAFQYFYCIKDINAILEGKGKTPNIELTTALKNAGICAERSNDTAGAIMVYKDQLVLLPKAIDEENEELSKVKGKSDEGSVKLTQVTEKNIASLKAALGMAYKGYAATLRKEKKMDEANKIVDEGLTKLPTDANLLVEKINVFLEDTNYTAALTYINSLLNLEPNNDGALFIKGLAYEKMGNEDSVIYYYTKSSEANPKNIKPWNNLGALYVNKANAMVDKLNALGNSDKEIAEYNKLKEEQKQLYLKAKPYLEKALEIDPTDGQIKQTLTQIKLKTGSE